MKPGQRTHHPGEYRATPAPSDLIHGDQVEVVRDAAGEPYVVIRRICDNLGVNFNSQLRNLKGRHWATVVMMTTVAQDGKRRELALLPVSQLAGWLFLINPKRVAPHVAEKLRLYQREAVDVLYRHFLAPAPPQPQVPVDPIIALHTSLLAMRQEQNAMRRRQAARAKADGPTGVTEGIGDEVADKVGDFDRA